MQELTDLTTALKNAVVAANAIAAAVKAAFPQATSTTSTTATAGSATLPAQPAGFLTATLNGTPVKIPYYNV